MDRVRCGTCGEEHDLSEMEPRFGWPRAYGEIPTEEREERAKLSDDWCIIRDTEDTWRRHFLRVLLPIPVRGERKPFCWGVWVEVDAADFRRACDLWDAPDQADEPPFPGALANVVHDDPTTLGLPGLVRLTSPTSVPHFALARELDHPLAREQREGVYPERLLEWLVPLLHA